MSAVHRGNQDHQYVLVLNRYGITRVKRGVFQGNRTSMVQHVLVVMKQVAPLRVRIEVNEGRILVNIQYVHAYVQHEIAMLQIPVARKVCMDGKAACVATYQEKHVNLFLLC